MSTTTENRLITINSKDAFNYNNGTYKSNVEFFFKGLIKKERTNTGLILQYYIIK